MVAVRSRQALIPVAVDLRTLPFLTIVTLRTVSSRPFEGRSRERNRAVSLWVVGGDEQLDGSGEPRVTPFPEAVG
jgi:hypothetical protein